MALAASVLLAGPTSGQVLVTDTYTVPDGVCTIFVGVVGGSGGAGGPGGAAPGRAGSEGVSVAAEFAVQPGDVLTAQLGGPGTAGGNGGGGLGGPGFGTTFADSSALQVIPNAGVDPQGRRDLAGARPPGPALPKGATRPAPNAPGAFGHGAARERFGSVHRLGAPLLTRRAGGAL